MDPDVHNLSRADKAQGPLEARDQRHVAECDSRARIHSDEEGGSDVDILHHDEGYILDKEADLVGHYNHRQVGTLLHDDMVGSENDDDDRYEGPQLGAWPCKIEYVRGGKNGAPTSDVQRTLDPLKS